MIEQAKEIAKKREIGIFIILFILAVILRVYSAYDHNTVNTKFNSISEVIQTDGKDGPHPLFDVFYYETYEEFSESRTYGKITEDLKKFAEEYYQAKEQHENVKQDNIIIYIYCILYVISFYFLWKLYPKPAYIIGLPIFIIFFYNEFAMMVFLAWFIYIKTFMMYIKYGEELERRTYSKFSIFLNFLWYAFPLLTVIIFIAVWLRELFGIDPLKSMKFMTSAVKVAGSAASATAKGTMAAAGAADVAARKGSVSEGLKAGKDLYEGTHSYDDSTVSNTPSNISSNKEESLSDDNIEDTTEQNVEVIGDGKIKKDGDKVFREFKVSSNGTGSIPNDTYTIEEYNGEYRAIRGSGVNPYYLAQNLTSENEALQHIIKDTKSNGATNITIK